MDKVLSVLNPGESYNVQCIYVHNLNLLIIIFRVKGTRSLSSYSQFFLIRKYCEYALLYYMLLTAPTNKPDAPRNIHSLTWFSS